MQHSLIDSFTRGALAAVLFTLGASSALAQSTPVRELAAPPSYLGTNKGSLPCRVNPVTGERFKTKGFEPVASGKYPLFIYMAGTESDIGTGYDAPAPLAVAKAMAERGFVAISASYDNGLDVFENKAQCLFNPTEPQSLIKQACSLPNVDCDNLGVAVWGHSQGGSLVLKAGNYKTSTGKNWVRAALPSGIGLAIDTSYKLPRDRVRVINGATDFPNNLAVLTEGITGLDEPSQCVGSSAGQCLRANGSGWIFVQKVDSPASSVVGSAHCWFQLNNCDKAKLVAPGFVDPTSNASHSLRVNANWLSTIVKTKGPW